MSSENSPMMSKITTPRVVVWGFVVLLVAVFATTTQADVLLRVGAISGLAIAMFATRLLPEVVTAIGCFLAFIAISAAPNDVIFSGFSSGGFWLLFSGLIIGTAISMTGLGMQIALRIFQRTGDSYRNAALLMAFSGLGLGLLVPATLPRIIVLMPIAMSLSKTMGYAAGSRGHVGLTVTGAAATLLPTYAILTANLPTIIHFGAFETLYDVRQSYALYFVEQAPINLIRFLTLLAIMLPFAAPRADAVSSLERSDPIHQRAKATSGAVGYRDVVLGHRHRARHFACLGGAVIGGCVARARLRYAGYWRDENESRHVAGVLFGRTFRDQRGCTIHRAWGVCSGSIDPFIGAWAGR